MLCNSVNNTYQYLDYNKCKYLQAGSSTNLTENNSCGKACLVLGVSNDVVLVDSPEKNIFPYLNKQPGNRRCCDKFIFCFDGSNGKDCTLYVIEFKKTVDVSILYKDIIQQLTMGILNARAIAGFLGANIVDIKACVAYRQFIKPANSIASRAANNTKAMQCFNAWNNGCLPLDLPEGTANITNLRLQLDSMGNGTMNI